ncbi:restriction endonuclease subunit S [bacterium]|nr:restriction endonuclease subunit S [bacterium]
MNKVEKIPADYKQTELGIIPEDWEVKKLGNIAKITRGASPRPIGSPIWFDEKSKIGWVRISDVTKSTKLLKYTTQKLSELGIKHSRFVGKSNLIMSICATVGRPILTEVDVCIHDGFVVFSDPKIEKEYLYYILSFIENDWASSGQIGSQMNLNTGLINFTQIAFPKSKTEQTAIATVLSDTDALIAHLEKLIAKKKAIKQGAMQQLLTGKKRLPGFNGGWEVKKLGEIVDFSNGKAHENFISDDGDYIVVNSKFISSEGQVIKYSKRCFCPAPADSILLVMSDVPNGKAIAKCFLVDKNDKYTVNQRICALRPKIDARFLFYKINRNSYYLTFDDGVKQTNLRKDDVLGCKLSIPKEEPEQTVIATILSDMDAEIESLEQKRDKYTMLKQGMMQQLLTGRIRIYDNN